ncbi:hypothetical protein N0V94_003272 [Neodidymelliopsis sp. IMI 364377]|nr:hypothetical protein N0V94_003272 [Neodidymelliopsis sp. IMI 364377]
MSDNDDSASNDTIPLMHISESDDSEPQSDSGWGDETWLPKVKIKPKDPREFYVSVVPYMKTTYDGHEEIHHTIAQAQQLETALKYFLHLRLHLRASTEILDRYTEAVFSQPMFESETPLEGDDARVKADQILFMHHHTAVSETLAEMFTHVLLYEKDFGVPCNSNFRHARNSFCHSMLTPGGREKWAGELEGLRKVHERLLRQVEGTIPLFEKQLADETVWEEPERSEEVVLLSWGDEGAPGSEDAANIDDEQGIEQEEEDYWEQEEAGSDDACLDYQYGFRETGHTRRWSYSHVESVEKGYIPRPYVDFLQSEEYDYLRR